MKKKHLFTVVATILCAAFCCGCTSNDPLVFKKNFYEGENEPSSGYTETLTYNVTFNATDNYKDKLSFSNGTLTTTLKVIPSVKSVTEIADSDILEKRPTGAETVYYYKTEFSINPTYNGITYSGTDTVVTECYFCSQRLSFAPIYSCYTAHYSLYSSAATEINPLDIKYTVNYSSNTYTLKSDIDGEKEEQQYKYKFQRLIDNTQLLFVARNITVTDKASFNMPTISMNYGSPKTLIFKEVSNTNYVNAINYNGTPVNSMTIQNLSFAINDTTSQGLPQDISIQTKQENVPFNAVVCRYTAPLIDYSTFANAGSLEYNLTNVSISK